MIHRFATRSPLLIGRVVATATAWSARGNPPLALSHVDETVSLSWPGQATLQTAANTSGPWQDLLGIRSPFTVTTTGAPQYFRTISRWERRAPLLQPNSEMGVAELDGKIYVLGGYPASRVTVPTVQVYDPESDDWRLTTPLPIPLNHPMPAVANGRLYLIGGQTNANNTGRFVSTVFEYNPVTSAWTSKASMPTARSSGAAVVIGNLI